MRDHLTIAGLSIATPLRSFLAREVLPGLPFTETHLWQGFADILADLAPQNAALLTERDRLQSEIDSWHRAHRGQPHDAGAYGAMLRSIGYLKPEPAPFTIATTGVDPEIARLAGPQLVVPVSNARYALNAANARWGSLYDAFYGTDAPGSPPPKGEFDVARAKAVIATARAILDEAVPLANGSHANAADYFIESGRLIVRFSNQSQAELANPGQCRGYRGSPSNPDAILLQHNGLHIELTIDHQSSIGSWPGSAGVKDILLESALTTIMDAEDSVTAVDAEDKVGVYRNWLGLMQGTLTAQIPNGNGHTTRALAEDRAYTALNGIPFLLPGRARMLVRHVGHHMLTDIVTLADGSQIPETFLDALITATIALHDIGPNAPRRNSPAGAVYFVKPKLHGPDEVALANALFERIETLLSLPPNTLKMGIMDEERRTSANLAACIHAARHRVVFINTGFLDRTGDEIHTSMEAGPVPRKADFKSLPWLTAYENRNVAIGLATGFANRAQIGKGMWAMPDRMHAMLDSKIAHPRAGASTAWVPSPTAATLHALHYFRVDVAARQAELAGRVPQSLDDLLSLPLPPPRQILTESEVQSELDNNIQGILGYVVRWVDQGIGCSKVPDIHDVGLMEDRATLRISSQHIANWLHHAIVSAEQVEASLRRMALLVDRQNAADPAYTPMAPGYDGPAFAAARDLIFQGRAQPSGYTEFILTRRRRQAKRRDG